jgi:iron complex outermembrane receptor protein
VIRTQVYSIFSVLLTTGGLLHAQSRAIRGTVQDPQRKLIDGAEILLFREGSAAALARTSSTQGAFAFQQSSTGSDWLEVSAPGFRKATVPVTTSEPLTIQLEVGGLDQRVLVTAEASAQNIDQISKAATVIDATEIAQRNEYSLSETLRDTPGLLVRNLGGPGQSTTVRMRGLRADATAMLIDGLRFRDIATTQADASSFLSTLNVINFDRVEVLRGSGSSLYGTNAVGGTINIVTDPGGGKHHGEIQTEGGTLGLLRGRATASGGFFDNRLTYSAGLLHLNVLSGVDGDDRARSTGLQNFLRYTVGPRTSLSGRLFFSDDFVQSNLSPTASGIPAANFPDSVIVPAIPLAPDQLLNSTAGLPIAAGNATFIPSRNDADNRRASRFWSGAVIARHSFTPTVDLQGSFQRLHTNRIFQNGPAGAGTQPRVSNFSRFRGDVDTADARLYWRAAQWISFSGGYEFEHEGYLNVDDNNLPAPTTVSTRTEAAQRSHAAYFAMQNTLAKQRLQISVSGRAQAFSLDRPSFVYTGTANNYSSIAITDPPRALTGDVAISYFIARSATKLRAHGGNSYRAPGLYERYGSGFFYNSTTNAVSFTPYGDPRLAPDRYNSIDAGIDQYVFGEKVRLSATWFYTRIVQITQFDSASSVVRGPNDPFGRTSGYFNGAGGTSRGAELSIETRPSRSSLARASYSYVNADTDQDTAVRGFFRALSVPTHSFTALWNQQIGRKTDLTFDLYHSGEYYNSLSAAGRARAYLYPSLTKIDAVFSRDLRTGEKYRLKAYAKVENMLNQRYFENGFRAPRATFLTGLRILFR